MSSSNNSLTLDSEISRLWSLSNLALVTFAITQSYGLYTAKILATNDENSCNTFKNTCPGLPSASPSFTEWLERFFCPPLITGHSAKPSAFRWNLGMCKHRLWETISLDQFFGQKLKLLAKRRMGFVKVGDRFHFLAKTVFLNSFVIVQRRQSLMSWEITGQGH